MRFVRSCAALAAALGLVVALAPTRVAAQTFALDPASASLPGIPASSADLLIPAAPPAPGPAPLPVVGMSNVTLGLLPGDVIDAFSLGDDAGPGATLYFTVSRLSTSVGPGPFPPDVFTEATPPPAGFQSFASADIFSTFDPACGVFPGSNTQVLDGDGAPIGPPFTCYGGFGYGLSEMLPAPGPPLVDQIADFDWATPGRLRYFCAYLSLAPGSPSLVPGSNPLMMAGAEPGDVLVSCPGFIPDPPQFIGVAFPAMFNGLISGGPGCAPPLCDDIDALTLFGNPMYSLAAGSPSLPLIPAGPADLLAMFSGPPPVIAIPAAALGLGPADDVKGLELATNACPVAPGSVPDPDGDGIAAACPDNCPGVFNPGQEDSDGDGVGDACDPCTEFDGDGFGDPGFPATVCPAPDFCPFTVGPNGDADGDQVGDICDNCPLVPNPNQFDTDGDSIGDACDTCTDSDGDGFGNPGFPLNTCATDNCPFTPNPGQADAGDGDGVGDACDNCPVTPNPGQEDPDFDSIGSACDNCPIDSNFGQADGDGDLIGDACDICTGGYGMTKAQIKIGKLLPPSGDEQLQVKGNISFPGLTLPIPPLDVINPAKGMRLQLVDLGAGSTVLFDYVVPGGPVPTVCGPKDGWKTNPGLTAQKYGNKTNQNQNGFCLPGSAFGINGAQAKDKTAKLKGAAFQVKGKNSTYGPVVGPVRMTVVLGGPGESAGGQCGHITFGPTNCALTGGGKTFKCK